MEQGQERGVALAIEETPTASPLTSFGHPAFHGTYRLKLDATGRVSLPASFKGAFSATGFIRPNRNSHLMLWTPSGFKAVADAFGGSGSSGVVNPRTRKRLHMSTTEVSVDRQSRFVIPPELRVKVGLGEAIVLAGAIETIEIWSADSFVDEEATFDDADLFFDGFEGL